MSDLTGHWDNFDQGELDRYRRQLVDNTKMTGRLPSARPQRQILPTGNTAASFPRQNLSSAPQWMSDTYSPYENQNRAFWTRAMYDMPNPGEREDTDPSHYANGKKDDAYIMMQGRVVARANGVAPSVLQHMYQPKDYDDAIAWNAKAARDRLNPAMAKYVWNEDTYNRAKRYNNMTSYVPVEGSDIAYDMFNNNIRRGSQFLNDTLTLPRGLFVGLPYQVAHMYGTVANNWDENRGNFESAVNRTNAINDFFGKLNQSVSSHPYFAALDWLNSKVQTAPSLQPRYMTQEQMTTVRNPDGSIDVPNLLTRAGWTSAELARNLKVFGGAKPASIAGSFRMSPIQNKPLSLLWDMGYTSEANDAIHKGTRYIQEQFGKTPPAKNQTQQQTGSRIRMIQPYSPEAVSWYRQ